MLIEFILYNNKHLFLSFTKVSMPPLSFRAKLFIFSQYRKNGVITN